MLLVYWCKSCWTSLKRFQKSWKAKLRCNVFEVFFHWPCGAPVLLWWGKPVSGRRRKLECFIDEAFHEHHLSLTLEGGGELVKWWFMLGWSSSLSVPIQSEMLDPVRAWFSLSSPTFGHSVYAWVCVSVVYCATEVKGNGVNEMRKTAWMRCT